MIATCTLYNLMTTCVYDQAFWIYRQNDYDQNILLAKGTKKEILCDENVNSEILEHINDTVELWTIREDGAVFVRLRLDERAEDLYSEHYVKQCDQGNPRKRPWLYSAEMDDFTHAITGSGKYLYPYGDPLECHHWEGEDHETD